MAMTAVGVTGIPGLSIVTSSSMLNYIIGLVIAAVVAFIASYMLGIKEEV
ncbi:MAG: hypothetical protein RSD13_05095 [Clostridium sp.]